MTIDGTPRSERELTVAGLAGVSVRQAFDDHFSGMLTLAAAAETMGVPVTQLVRWCGDGTVPEEAFTGNPLSPGRLRFDGEWVRQWTERREGRL